MHRTYKMIGHELLSRWGKDDRGDVEEMIKQLPHDYMQICILAVVVDELNAIRALLARNNIEAYRTAVCRDEQERSDTAIADGMLRALKLATEVRLPDGCPGLSPRSRNILRREGIEFVSECTREHLSAIRNCGEVATTEIVKWVERLVSSLDEADSGQGAR